jgi:4-hydroxy-3-methylbut-2-enyl diphosphate reductase
VIFGKKGHAEVNGLMGQTDETAIVIEKKEDIEKLDFSRDISLFSQTTKPLDGFQEIGELIKSRMKEGATFEFYDTICRQVSNRVPNMHEFAKKHDLVIFIAGEKSSNGKVLFAECKKHNENSYLIHDPDQINPEWIRDDISIGICGATSTPMWQMEAVAKKIKELIPETEVEKAAF